MLVGRLVTNWIVYPYDTLELSQVEQLRSTDKAARS